MSKEFFRLSCMKSLSGDTDIMPSCRHAVIVSHNMMISYDSKLKIALVKSKYSSDLLRSKGGRATGHYVKHFVSRNGLHVEFRKSLSFMRTA